MRDLSPGMKVFDETGAPCDVVSVSDVMENHQLYRVEFDDGSYIDADSEHLWCVFTDSDRTSLKRRTPEFRAARRAIRPSRGNGDKPWLAERNKQNPPPSKDLPTGRIMKTRDMIGDVIIRNGTRKNYSIRVSEPVQYPENELLIHPYVLGVWLGDGTSAGNGFTSNDIEIINQIRSCGYEVIKRADTYGYGIQNITTKLRRIGVLKNKHIPRQYITASISQRMELLKGLMDTDGTCLPSGSCEFYTTSPQLAKDARELLISLGIKCNVKSGRAMLNGKDCGEKYRIKFTTSTPVFHLPRKQERQVTIERGVQNWRYITAITPIESEPVKCIAVNSPSHLYLAGKELIPTHNSDALLMSALMFVIYPQYRALMIRKTYADLSLPDSLMDRANQWLRETDAEWVDKTKTWEFPNGSSLTFAYLQSSQDKFRYSGSAFHFVAFDELTQFKEEDYRFLFSRVRKATADPIPLRMRCATNPGNIGHDWVKERFLEGGEPEALFIKSLLTDNPFLDQESYRKALSKLDPVTRQQLENGDWDIGLEGEMFKRHWFPIVPGVDARYTKHRVRFWDLASTAPGDATKDPDFCASCLMGMAAIDDYCISDITNVRYNESETEAFIASVVHSDGPGVIQVFEREGGSDGKLLHEAWKKTILKGVISEFIPSRHSKIIRAKLPSAAAERGEIKLLEAEWNKMLLDQLTKFPNVLHDDITDCVSGSFTYLQRYVSMVKNSDLPKRGAIIGRTNATGIPVISQRNGFNSW